MNFKQWLEDAGETSGRYSNAEDPDFSDKCRSKYSARGAPKKKKKPCLHCDPLMGFMKDKMKKK
jgi:hypothetical protein